MTRMFSALAFAFALVLCATAAKAAVLLDDYSTDTSSSYIEYTWYGAAGQFNLVGGNGALAPYFAGDGASAFFWNGGQLLKPGDSVALDVATGNNGVATGIALATDPINGPQQEVTLQYSSTDPNSILWGVNTPAGRVSITGPDDWAKMSTLTLTRGIGAHQADIAWSLTDAPGISSGVSGGGTVTLSGVSGNQGLYFGPSSYDGGRADNLTYSAVPEPSTLLLAAMGLVGLLAYAWRKRK